MLKGFPDKKISKTVKDTLEKNGFVFVRCTGHAIFKHSASSGMFPVSVSKKKAKFYGDKYIVILIKKFVESKNCVFVE
jgi:predicted RNA binding protein YcfA (HicA-like mRNA interferase family)